MKHLICAAALSLIVSACATSSVYGPALSTGDYGYREQTIEPDRYRISYRGRNDQAAMDGALRRAAEITIAEGFDYFTVVDRDVEDSDGRRRGPTVGIGGSTGSGRGWGGTRVGVGVNIPLALDNDVAIARLEMVMGRGIKPDDPTSYNARQVLENLVPTRGNQRGR